MALRNLLVRVGSDISGLTQGLKNAQKSLRNFSRSATNSLKTIQGELAATAAAFGAGFAITTGIQDAMRYEALMVTLGESMGESRKEFEKWQETVGSAMGFSRLEAADLANTLSLNFKQIATSQEDLVNKTTKMMEVAALISNKRGMAMSEVSDRIRSAMNQEADGAEELGVNVKVAAIEMSDAFKEMANGQPWAELTTNMQKAILYQHILQQVSENLGETMQDTTAMRMAAFTASLADVRLALGQAFLPILHVALPALNKLAQAVYRALQVVAAFSRSLFGGGFKFSPVSNEGIKATNEQAKALGGVGSAAEEAGAKSSKAAKKAEKAWSGTFGFDEVNTIKDPSESAGGAAGGAEGLGGGLGGAGLEMPPMDNKPFLEGVDELARKMDKFTAPIKKAFKAAWNFISSYLKEKLSEIRAWWKENGATIMQAIENIKNFVIPVFEVIGKFILDSVVMIVDGFLKAFMGIITFLAGVFTGDFTKAWNGLKETFFGIVELMFGFWNLSFIGGIKKALLNFIASGGRTISKFAGDIKTFFSNALTDIRAAWRSLVDRIKTLITEAKDFIEGRVEIMQTSFKGFWDKVAAGATKAVEVLKSVWGGIKEFFIRTVINPVVGEMEKIRDAFSEGIGEGFKYLMNQVIKGINNGIKALNKVKNGLPFGDKMPDLPTIPRLAQGGITNGATLAMVGDNVGGREVISPLDRLESMLTNSVIQAMQLGNTNNNNQTTGDIILNIDGRSFARIVKPFLDQEQSRVGSDVRIRSI